jgi:hypothetical protein
MFHQNKSRLRIFSVTAPVALAAVIALPASAGGFTQAPVVDVDGED